MKRVELTLATRTYLKQANFLPPLLQHQIDGWPSKSQCQLELDDNVAEDFRSAFTERLAQVGFDNSYKLNGEGALLEELIDRFA